MALKVGDIVTRQSYGEDMLFRITDIKEKEKIAILKGLDFRLIADAPLKDLKKASHKQVIKSQEIYKNKSRDCISRKIRQRHSSKSGVRGNPVSRSAYFEIPGKVLHLDGDKEYLEESLGVYSKLEMNVKGFHVPEKKQPEVLGRLLEKHNPDILVLTGHDAFLKGKKNFQDVNNYRHSKFFLQSVKIARKYEPNKDSLIIYAGACQSHYESLIAAGANYAASPQRVFIHNLDPVFITEKVAYTSITKSVDISDVINDTITGIDGIGGIETRGTFRVGLPESPY